MTSTLADLVPLLRRAGATDVVGPQDERYPALTALFDLSTRCTPDAVVAATGPADVIAALHVARDHHVPLTVLGTGHGQLADVVGGIAVNTAGLAGVAVDPATRTARIGAGTTWQQVLEAAAPHGLAAPCGSAPGVGVVGYLLGGGVGPLARTLGFSSDFVLGLEIVTPAGDFISVTAQSEPELFWALRGGKGGFGVVMALTLALQPLTHFYGGGLYFPAPAASAVLHTWATWSTGLPETVTTSVAVLRLPDLPMLPPPLRGQCVVHVRVATVLEPAAAEELLAPIRALGAPLLDSVGQHPYPAIGLVHADPVGPLPILDATVGLSSFDADAVDALLAAAGPEVRVPVAVVEVRQLGGATARPGGGPDAVSGRELRHSLFVSGAPLPDQELVRGAVQAVVAAFEPWRAPTTLVNFVGSCNEPGALTASWTPEQNSRLAAIRAAVDPDGLFPFGSGA